MTPTGATRNEVHVAGDGAPTSSPGHSRCHRRAGHAHLDRHRTPVGAWSPTPDELRAGLLAQRLSGSFVDDVLALDRNVAAGGSATTTIAVTDLTGHPARSISPSDRWARTSHVTGPGTPSRARAVNHTTAEILAGAQVAILY